MECFQERSRYQILPGVKIAIEGHENFTKMWLIFHILIDWLMISLTRMFSVKRCSVANIPPDKHPATMSTTCIQNAIGCKIYDFTWLQNKNIGGVHAVFLTSWCCWFNMNHRVPRICYLIENNLYHNIDSKVFCLFFVILKINHINCLIFKIPFVIYTA